MKKSLIALAALAATGAFAQSSVTISGHLDVAGANVTGTQLLAKGSTFADTTGTSSTSVLRFIAVEDLGGGMKVTAQYNFDPRTIFNDGTNVNFSSSSSTVNVLNGVARDEVFLGLSGNAGNLRLGAANSLGLVVHGLSSPLGTGVGSGYALTQLYSNVRYDRSARYDSPSFNGLTAHLLYAPGNDQATSAAVPLSIKNARQTTEAALVYTNGPLNVGYAYIAQDATTNGTGFFTPSSSGVAPKTATNILSANYTMGNTTVYAGWNDGDALNVVTLGKIKGYRVAAKHTIGAIDLMAQFTQQEPALTLAAKHQVTGLRADYNLSKTAAVYVGYEKYDSKIAYSSASTTTAAYTGDRTTVSVGLRKSF